MTDYIGNEIKEGMTIKVIRTKPFFSEFTPYVAYKGKLTQIGPTVKSPKSCWECVGEYEIRNHLDKLYYLVKWGEITYWSLLNGIDFGFQPGDLLTIKGISDEKPMKQSKKK